MKEAVVSDNGAQEIGNFMDNLNKKMHQHTMNYINERLGCKCIEENPWSNIDCIAYDPEEETTVFFEICYHNDEDKFMSRKDREAAMLGWLENVNKSADDVPIKHMRWDRISWQMMPSLGESKALFKYVSNI